MNLLDRLCLLPGLLWSRLVQDTYDLESLRKAEHVVVFLVPPEACVNGGVMSIFSLCQASRQVCPEAVCLISTWPGRRTHAANREFRNREKVHRWKQVVRNARRPGRMTLHLPEMVAARFVGLLDGEDLAYLKGLPQLQINILNQNLELMPPPSGLAPLFRLTPSVTQTTGHHRYATQETSDLWGIPAHLFSVQIDMSPYRAVPFSRKSRTLVLSPDANACRARIVERLESELPDYRLVTVRNLTFDEYMDLVASSRFSITFGEGFDGYFVNPFLVGGVGFAVYNDEFFPDRSWLENRNVYASYEVMLERIVQDIRFLEADAQAYEDLSARTLARLQGLYRFDAFLDNLRRFYQERYDFLPAPFGTESSAPGPQTPFPSGGAASDRGPGSLPPSPG